MNPLPLVAIVGRPNVGKSTLFNRFAGRRALAFDTPGITRDRITAEVEAGGRRVLLVDTAGLDPDANSEIEHAVQQQVQHALAAADAILFVVDGQAGRLPLEDALARKLRRSAKPVTVAVNKIDERSHQSRLYEFYALGIEPLRAVSAEHGGGAWDALEELVAALPPEPTNSAEEEGARATPPTPNDDEPQATNASARNAQTSAPDESSRARGEKNATRRRRSATADLHAEEARAADDVGASGVALQGARDGAAAPRDALAPEPRIAIVGRPNAGKSSLLNRLLGEPRVVVSELPGTTRDAVDVLLEHATRRYRFIDTAGLRRAARREERVERGSALMTLRAIKRASLALVLFDAESGPGDQDLRVLSLVHERGCAAAVLVNKWDRVENAADPDAAARLEDELARRLRPFADTPVLRLSAKSGRGVARLWPLLDALARAHARRIPTAALNRWLRASVARFEPAMATHGARRRPVKLLYATQTATRPPAFTVFCNEPDALQAHYRRFLENRLREHFDFAGVPLTLHFRRS